jgi:hypothetical protein
MLIPLGFLAGILVLNWRFYVFLARTRHPLFAAFACPLQILYYLYSLATFCLAVVAHIVQIAWAFLRQAAGRADSLGSCLPARDDCPKSLGAPVPVSQNGVKRPQALGGGNGPQPSTVWHCHFGTPHEDPRRNVGGVNDN